jgi:hypothetical protein
MTVVENTHFLLALNATEVFTVLLVQMVLDTTSAAIHLSKGPQFVHGLRVRWMDPFTIISVPPTKSSIDNILW